MTNIVGIFCIGPNPAACLVQDGHLVAMAEEERFVRNKDIELHLPVQAMHYCLREGGIELKNIDTIAYAWDTRIYRGRIFGTKLKRWFAHNRRSDIKGISLDELCARSIYALLEVGFHHPSFVRQMLRNHWDTIAYDLPLPEVHFVPHHLAHAAATYYTSGFDQATILTMDRNGEEICSAIWIAEGLNIRLVEKYELPHSLGWFYAGFTDYLGFRPEYHEGKVMGLSAYGASNEEITRKMDKVLTSHADGSYSLDPTYFFYGPGYGYAYSKKMVDLFGSPRRGDNDSNIEPYYKDIAYAAQERLEHVVLNLARRAIQLTQQSNLCLAGGVSLNCVANGKLARSDFVNRVHVPPPNNDSGAALGAALWMARKQGAEPRFTLKHANWGPGYTDDEICRELDRLGISYQRHEAIEKVVAHDLAADQTVAWFQGRMEMGPRALGARSILGTAHDPEMFHRLNKIKGRESWRPLAPAILEEAADEYLIEAQPSPFMTLAFSVRADKRDAIPAVVHIDGTTRPQTVSRDSCPLRYWNVLKEFQALTGIPLFVNTSFNTRGEPIVCSVVDAVRTFYGSEIDELAIGPALVYKHSRLSPRFKKVVS